MNEVAFDIDAEDVAALNERYPDAHLNPSSHIGHWRVGVWPHCLCIDGPQGKIDYPWRIVHGIETARDGALIAAGAARCWLPRSAFREWTTFEQFISRLIIEMGPRKEFLRCRKCGYDLRAAPDAGCPECGWRRT